MARIKKIDTYTTEITNQQGEKTGRYNTYGWIGKNVYRSSGTKLKLKVVSRSKKSSGGSGG